MKRKISSSSSEERRRKRRKVYFPPQKFPGINDTHYEQITGYLSNNNGFVEWVKDSNLIESCEVVLAPKLYFNERCGFVNILFDENTQKKKSVFPYFVKTERLKNEKMFQRLVRSNVIDELNEKTQKLFESILEWDKRKQIDVNREELEKLLGELGFELVGPINFGEVKQVVELVKSGILLNKVKDIPKIENLNFISECVDLVCKISGNLNKAEGLFQPGGENMKRGFHDNYRIMMFYLVFLNKQRELEQHIKDLQKGYDGDVCLVNKMFKFPFIGEVENYKPDFFAYISDFVVVIMEDKPDEKNLSDLKKVMLLGKECVLQICRKYPFLDLLKDYFLVVGYIAGNKFHLFTIGYPEIEIKDNGVFVVNNVKCIFVKTYNTASENELKELCECYSNYISKAIVQIIKLVKKKKEEDVVITTVVSKSLLNKSSSTPENLNIDDDYGGFKLTKLMFRRNKLDVWECEKNGKMFILKRFFESEFFLRELAAYQILECDNTLNFVKKVKIVYVDMIIIYEKFDKITKEMFSDDKEVYKLIVDIGNVLLHLHKNGHIHCDIKISNILKNENGYFLNDFDVSVKNKGLFIGGSEDYRAKETYQKDCQVCDRTDIYSFGVLLRKLRRGSKQYSFQPVNDFITKAMQQLEDRAIDKDLKSLIDKLKKQKKIT